MSDLTALHGEAWFTEGVLTRRVIAWLVDMLLIGVLLWVLWWILLLFGVVTFGVGYAAMTLLPVVPFLYHFLSLLRPRSATPGQSLTGLTVRSDFDLAPPTVLQALIFTVVFYLTLATSGLLLVVVWFTPRKRTLHDLVSGLVVVRTRGMEALTVQAGPPNMGRT